jgi:sugar lactone lactonase YvrE
MSDPVDVVLDKVAYLEGPRWHAGRVWVSDFYLGQVLSAEPDGSDLRVEAEVPEQPSGTGWLPDGRLLVVSMRDRRILRREPDGSLVTHADLAGLAAGVLNDMGVDPEGHCWVGCFGFDLMGGADLATAPLIRVDPDGTAEIVAEGLAFPNGTVADGRSVVVAETFGNRISRFAVRADGSLGPREDFARFGDPATGTTVGEVLPQLAVLPDGISEPDAEGAIWVADADHHRAIRVRPGGEVAGAVTVAEQVFAAALGGPDGHTLFLASAPSFLEHERRHTRDGKLLATRVEVPLA